MLGDAEAIVDRPGAALSEQTRRSPQLRRVDPGARRRCLGRMPVVGDEASPGFEIRGIAAFPHEGLVDETLGYDHMRERVHDGDVRARPQREMMVRLDMRHADDINPAGIDYDQLRALAQPSLHARGEDGMRVGRIRADDEDHVRLVNRLEVLRTRRGAKRLAEAITRRRVAYACAGIDVVVAEARANQLLNQEHLLVGAARGGNGPEGVAAVSGPDAFEFARRIRERLVPGDLAPGIVDLGPDHRLDDAILVSGVAIGEAALDAGMAFVRLAGLVGDHADDLFALHLGLERAADAAIGAGGDDRAFRLARGDDALFVERRRRARLHASAAGNAFRAEKVAAARRDLGLEAAPQDSQRERALHLLA